MEENLGIKGQIHYVLKDKDGDVKEENTSYNTITEVMDAHVADQMSDSGDAAIGFIALGIGSGQTTSDTDLNSFSAGTFLALSGTLQGTAAADNDVVYSGYWGAGVGTATITEAGIFQASGTTRTTMCTYNDSINFAKGASDTLKIDWTVTFGDS